MNSKIKNNCIIIIGILILILLNDKSKIKTITNPDDYLVLVNKYNKLPNTYIPTDLKLINNNFSKKDKFLRNEALINFENLCKDALNLGFKIKAVSSYRDYEYQNNLFTYYTKNKGIDYALKCSAKPGFSEHQTGLAVDVEGSNNDYNLFASSNEFEWMINNSYKYGFILRYPKNKENITGYKYEPWHYRYVGIKHAKIIHEKNLTLEEYKKSYK